MFNFYLNFSDSAKIAQAASHLNRGLGYTITHTFFSAYYLNPSNLQFLFKATFLPLNSLILSLFFRFLPTSDWVIALVGITLGLLTALLVLLIGKKLHSTIAGITASALFVLNPFIIDYALNFSTETLFMFLLVLSVYIMLLKGKTKLIAFIPLALMVLNRPQCLLIYFAMTITGFIYFLTRKKLTHVIRKISIFLLINMGIYLLLHLLTRGTFYWPLWPVFSIPLPNGQAADLRGGVHQAMGLAGKLFYNTYNFLKVPERLVWTPILVFFTSSLFIKTKNQALSIFRLFSVFAFLLFLAAAVAVLPFARYVHPVLPLIFISAGIFLAEISRLTTFRWGKFFVLITVIFLTLPTIGKFTVDQRYIAKNFNTNRPPATKVISDIMAEHISTRKMIITNLDAWAAWYHDLTTMWFPSSPDQLKTVDAQTIDYIVITNYNENDADFALGDWKEVVYQPDKIQNQYLKMNFKLLKKVIIVPNQVYENREYRLTILQRK